MTSLMEHPLFMLAGYWGWALFHSLWQLSVLGLLAAGLQPLLKKSGEGTRYLFQLCLLGCMFLAPLTTFLYLTPHGAYAEVWSLLSPGGSETTHAAAATEVLQALPVAAPGGAAPDAGPAHAEVSLKSGITAPVASWTQRVMVALQDYVLLAVALWSFGVFLLSLRLGLGSCWILRTSRSSAQMTPPTLEEILQRACASLGCKRGVRVAESALVQVPCLLGWLRPLILLPPAAVAGLTPRQVEMVIAHEVAHLVRHDPLVNVLQTLIETLLFYHPAVWWLSRQIRQEREMCCDALVLRTWQDPLAYARTLAAVAAFRLSPLPVCALSMTEGSLTQRIRRLLEAPAVSGKDTRPPTGVALVLMLGMFCALIAASVAHHVLSETAGPTSWVRVHFPLVPPQPVADGSVQGAGIVCVRAPGTTSFFDWMETLPATGEMDLPPDVEVGLKLAPERMNGLDFLDTLPAERFSGMLLGAFYLFRGGSRPPEAVYADLLQTEARTRMPLYDADLPHLLRFTQLRDLYLDHSFVSDAGMEVISQLQSLETLSLVDTEITDDALAWLATLPKLRHLELSETAVTDFGLEALSEMATLEEITLDRCAVTDAGVAILAQLPSLRKVSLNFTPLSDAGARLLMDLPSRPVVRAWGTAVSAGTLTRGESLPPRVGILLSEFSAEHEHSMPYAYTYGHTVGIAQLLMDLGYDLYAVIDPGSENSGYLPQVLERLGLTDRTVSATDSAALAGLEVVVKGHSPMMRDEVLGGLRQAVENGLGLVSISVFGNRIPAQSADLCALLGNHRPAYYLRFEFVDCTVAEAHPILGNLQPGDNFTVKWLNGAAGSVEGTCLLSTEANPGFCPLYVHALGQGTVVNVQWQQVSIGNGDVDPVAFYGRCVNFAAGLDAGATW